MNLKMKSWDYFKELAKEAVEKTVEAYPEKLKYELSILPCLSPVETLSRKELEDLIDSYVDTFSKEVEYTEEELRIELLDKKRIHNLKTDINLPTHQLKEAMREELKAMSSKELTKVYPGVTEKEALKAKGSYVSEIVDQLRITSIYKTKLKLSPEEAKDIKEEILEGIAKNIGDIVPKELSFSEGFFKRVVLGIYNRDLKQYVKTYE